MGVLSDLLGSPKSFDGSLPREGSSRITCRKLNDILDRMGDFDYPSGYDGVDTVQEIAAHEAGTNAGNYTITINLADGTSFTTASLAFDAAAAAIQSAIDTAADGVVAGYTAGDIAITGGPLSTTALTITFSGDSVANDSHPAAEITSVDLNASGTPTDPGAVTVETAGQPARSAWAALKHFSIITSAPATYGSDVTSATVGLGRGEFPHQLDNDTVIALINEAAVQDGLESTRTVLMAALGF